MISSPVLGISQGPCVAESEPALLTGSKQFGLSRNSHIAIAFDDTKVKNRYVLFCNTAQELLNIHI
jgi:laminin alpha 1/2